MARQPAPPDPDTDRYTTGQVAAMYRVDRRTAARWAADGKVPEGKITLTPGGHRRWDGPWVRSLLAGGAR